MPRGITNKLKWQGAEKRLAPSRYNPAIPCFHAGLNIHRNYIQPPARPKPVRAKNLMYLCPRNLVRPPRSSDLSVGPAVFCVVKTVFRKQNHCIAFTYFVIFLRYPTLLHLPPLRFHHVGGCWDRTQDSCDYGIGCQTLQPLARSHPLITNIGRSASKFGKFANPQICRL